MTSIGIIVGATTIVMVIAIGKGGQADVADQFKNLKPVRWTFPMTAGQILAAEEAAMIRIPTWQ